MKELDLNHIETMFVKYEFVFVYLYDFLHKFAHSNIYDESQTLEGSELSLLFIALNLTFTEVAQQVRYGN